MRYTTLFVRDKKAGGYTVRVPALRGCITEGDSLPQAIDNAREAMALYLEEMADHGETCPPDATTIELYEWEDEVLVLRVDDVGLIDSIAAS